MTDVTILAVPLGLAALLAAMRTVYWLRGRAMFALAARLSFRYVGPRAPASWWWNPQNGRTGPPSSKLGFQCQSMRVSCEPNMERHGGEAQWNADPRLRRPLWIERRSAIYCHRVPDRAESLPNGLDGRSHVSITSMDTPSWRHAPWFLMDNEHQAARRLHRQFAAPNRDTGGLDNSLPARQGRIAIP